MKCSSPPCAHIGAAGGVYGIAAGDHIFDLYFHKVCTAMLHLLVRRLCGSSNPLGVMCSLGCLAGRSLSKRLRFAPTIHGFWGHVARLIKPWDHSTLRARCCFCLAPPSHPSGGSVGPFQAVVVPGLVFAEYTHLYLYQSAEQVCSVLRISPKHR